MLLAKDIGFDGSFLGGLENGIPRCKMSVVADSNSVKVYTLTRQSLPFVPDDIKKIMVKGARKYGEFDQFVDEDKLEEEAQWEKLKREIVEETIQQSFQERKPIRNHFKDY